jgi:hypothetical protein
MNQRSPSTRQHHGPRRATGALGPPPVVRPVLVALTVKVPESTKRALKIRAAETGETERVIADRAIRTELGLEP